MRDFEQRKEEIFARSRERIARRKRNTRRIVLTCVPLLLCVCLTGSFLAMGGLFAAKESASMENMEMDSLSAGDKLYGGAEVPECAPMGEPEGTADVTCLELYRESKTYSYTEPDVVNIFLNILEGEMLPPPGGMSPAEGDPIEYYFRYEPEKMIRDDRYLVKLTYPDGETIYFTLEDNWLTRQDNQAYILTDEQASILYKLMEVEWP